MKWRCYFLVIKKIGKGLISYGDSSTGSNGGGVKLHKEIIYILLKILIDYGKRVE